MSPRVSRPETPVEPSPDVLQVLSEVANGPDGVLKVIAEELMRQGRLLSAGATPDLGEQIDRTVAMVLARGNQKDEKGAYIVGAKEIDAAVKWYVAKHKVDIKEDEPEEEEQLGAALGRGSDGG